MLEVTVFLGGALVMVLEMVGARVLAPHVGTSAVVWTSLIGVVLAWGRGLVAAMRTKVSRVRAWAGYCWGLALAVR